MVLSRRLAREVVFKALFQVDVGKCSAKEALLQAGQGFSFSGEEENFIRELVDGTLSHWEELDRLIKDNLVNWEMERLSAVDRNLIRLALYEILYRPDIPVAVSINEALELAKKYGSNRVSVRFINGILDKLAEKKR